MRSQRWASLLGLLGVVAACGGRQVTGESSSGGAMPTGGAGGTVAIGPGGGGTVVIEPGGSKPSRCTFAPTTMPTGTSTPSPTIVSPAIVQSRIERFILGEAKTPPSPAPAQLTPRWAGDTAMKLLDGFNAAGSEAPGGFIRWLTKWSYDNKAPASAARWANVMAAPSATLSSLIAAPNPDAPHGVGYMTDPDLLTGRPTIDRRGMMVSSQLLCLPLVPAPPPGLVSPVPSPGMTERQLHAANIAQAVCGACHQWIDPFGHAFGHFDRSGAYRDLDNGLPVDTADEYDTMAGSTIKFAGLEGLASQLAESCEVARCISQSLLREATSPDLASNVDPPFSDDDVIPIANAFADSGFSIRTVVRSVVESPAFLR